MKKKKSKAAAAKPTHERSKRWNSGSALPPPVADSELVFDQFAFEFAPTRDRLGRLTTADGTDYEK